MQVNACIHCFIWPYIPICALFWCLRGAEDLCKCTGCKCTGNLFPLHLHPGSWYVLHLPDTAMVQRHPTYLQVVIAPAQLSG